MAWEGMETLTSADKTPGSQKTDGHRCLQHTAFVHTAFVHSHGAVFCDRSCLFGMMVRLHDPKHSPIHHSQYY